MPVDAAVGVVY